MPADSFKRMDSTGSNSKNDIAEDSLSTSPGTSSENSGKSARFILPGIGGSPPKVLTMDEVVNVVNNIQKMELVHEIALNPDFKLQPYEPPEESLEKRIKDTMHKAFWDVLREQLNRDPPCFDHAIQLLSDIKECLAEIIPSNNQKLLDHINEVLDTTVVRQQAEQGVIDFRSYANFVIQIMAKSCAPVRDEQVQKLLEIDDVVETFKGILETMQLMKLDVVNCLLEFTKKDLLANSAEYEKKKFKEYLNYYKFGFPATENWLKRNQKQETNMNATNTSKATPYNTICNAYLELLDWDDSNEYPEILPMDRERLMQLSYRFFRLYISASIIAICSGIPIITRKPKIRTTIVHQIQILLQNVTKEKGLKESLENIWLQIRKVLNDESECQITAEMENTLKAQILQIEDKESPVRKLMYDRLKSYFHLVLRVKSGSPALPSGYADLKEELESVVNGFRRIINYNYSVFGEFFIKILTENESSDQSAEETTKKSNSESAF